jgi:hypothetical protein
VQLIELENDYWIRKFCLLLFYLVYVCGLGGERLGNRRFVECERVCWVVYPVPVTDYGYDFEPMKRMTWQTTGLWVFSTNLIWIKIFRLKIVVIKLLHQKNIVDVLFDHIQMTRYQIQFHPFDRHPKHEVQDE